MPNLAGARLVMGIAADNLCLVLEAGWGRKQAKMLLSVALPVDRPADQALPGAIAQLLLAAPSARLPLSVVVADRLARYFVTTPPRNASSMADCKSAVAMRFEQLYGQSTAAWQIASSFDPMEPFVSCALPQQLIGAIEIAAAARRLYLRSILPAFVAGWNRWQKLVSHDTWYCTALAGDVCLGVIQGGRLTHVRFDPFNLATVEHRQELVRVLTREALAANAALPARLVISTVADSSVDVGADTHIQIIKQASSSLPSAGGAGTSESLAALVLAVT